MLGVKSTGWRLAPINSACFRQDGIPDIPLRPVVHRGDGHNLVKKGLPFAGAGVWCKSFSFTWMAVRFPEWTMFRT